MDEIVKVNNGNELEMVENEPFIVQYSNELLAETRKVVEKQNTLSIPIAELSTLGAGVSSLVPAVETVTQTTTIAADGLYKLANAAVGDTLKVAKNGNFWGAFRTADGASKFAQLQAAGPISATTTTQAVAAINPATMLMAVALFSIEKELGNIAEMEKKILSFLEIEKQSKIEGDVETLMDVAIKYKDNWDNSQFVNNNHKLMLDIQRTARANMIEFQKQVEETLKKKTLVVNQSKVESAWTDLEKKFKYYRLSLYNYSLASMMEIMLSGNYKESYIEGVRKEIGERTYAYRELFDRASIRLEKLGHASVEANVVKGIGVAGKTVGKVIGNIPLVEKGPVDEFLEEKSGKLKHNAYKMKTKAVKSFTALSNPGTGVFLRQMDDISQIYNHTKEIYFDKDKIYLVAE